MELEQNTPTRIFAVEDEDTYRRMVEYILKMNPDHEVHSFASAKDCLDHMHLAPAIVTVDFSLPDMNGLELLKELKAQDENVQVIVLSGQQDVSTAVQLMQAGAFDYVTKDENTKDRLLYSLRNAKQKVELKEEVRTLKKELISKHNFDKLIKGQSTALKRIFGMMEKACGTNINVSISGETGTGKEVVAKAIHYNSKWREGKFVAVNVSAIPSDLLESELFGYEKGAFTGANTRKIGYFEQADGGTIFLDEIAEMDINMQAKILRALQEREITRVGGTTPVKFNARLISATHRNLGQAVNEGSFREDLYYRLMGLPIDLPPLRDRGSDILILARYFVDEFAKINELGKLVFSDEAQDKLMDYHYPGNVRELRAVVELASVMCADGIIEASDIRFNSPKKEEVFLNKEATLKEYTSKIVQHYLDKYDSNVLLVADKLGIGKSTIYRMLKDNQVAA